MFYRLLMKLAHRYNWHYAPPIYPGGDTQLWCQWCGLKQTVCRRADYPAIAKAPLPARPEPAPVIRGSGMANEADREGSRGRTAGGMEGNEGDQRGG